MELAINDAPTLINMVEAFSLADNMTPMTTINQTLNTDFFFLLHSFTHLVTSSVAISRYTYTHGHHKTQVPGAQLCF